MSRRGERGWLETAVWYAEGLPEGSARRPALLQKCEREGADPRLISRMISARAYALKWIDEDQIQASHKAVEILRTLDNLNPAKAAAVRSDVLKGVMGRPEATLILNDEKTAFQNRKKEDVSMTLDDIIRQCRDEIPALNEFEWIEPPEGDKGVIFGADAEYCYLGFDEDYQEVTNDPRWALVVSPYISCSKIFGSGLKGFVLSIAALSWSYPLVSVFCSSAYERSEVMRIISANMSDVFRNRKIHFHIAQKA